MFGCFIFGLVLIFAVFYGVRFIVNNDKGYNHYDYQFNYETTIKELEEIKQQLDEQSERLKTLDADKKWEDIIGGHK